MADGARARRSADRDLAGAQLGAHLLILLHDEATAEQIRELVAKGALGGLVFITEDARALYDTLRERGVTDFTQEPTEHFYGTDMGLRDPFGNPIRILQQGKAT